MLDKGLASAKYRKKLRLVPCTLKFNNSLIFTTYIYRVKGRHISTKNAKIWKYVATDKNFIFL